MVTSSVVDLEPQAAVSFSGSRNRNKHFNTEPEPHQIDAPVASGLFSRSFSSSVAEPVDFCAASAPACQISTEASGSSSSKHLLPFIF
jgi:hypothetical protein